MAIFFNDMANSMRLVGPLPAGLKIELGDTRDIDEICSDDYALVTLKKPLGRTEEICIKEFEQTKLGASRYEMHYVEDNGLDGKVSVIEIMNPPEGTDVA